jgi:two-component system chemotaxis response regulator CheY
VKTILLVNESRVTLELIKVYLTGKDVRVIEAVDGLDAMVLARAERPDLVLCDLQLPRLDGVGLCRELRADVALRNIPVIVLTSDPSPETRLGCQRAGASSVLLKPIGPRALREAVQLYGGITVGLPMAKPVKLDRAG